MSYIKNSHYPWLVGQSVLMFPPTPAWNDSFASVANMAIMKMMEYKPR